MGRILEHKTCQVRSRFDPIPASGLLSRRDTLQYTVLRSWWRGGWQRTLNLKYTPSSSVTHHVRGSFTPTPKSSPQTSPENQQKSAPKRISTDSLNTQLIKLLRPSATSVSQLASCKPKAQVRHRHSSKTIWWQTTTLKQQHPSGGRLCGILLTQLSVWYSMGLGPPRLSAVRFLHCLAPPPPPPRLSAAMAAVPKRLTPGVRIAGPRI